MTEDDAEIWTLAVSFAVLSCLAIGGVSALLPEMHRQAVDVHGWMSSQRFTDFYALSQAAPGPNLTVISLIGWTVAGAPGVVAANVAFVGPTSVLTFFLARTWARFREARWRVAVQIGLLPVTAGLIGSAAYLLAKNASDTIVGIGITAITAAAAYFTRTHPLIFLGAGAALGLAGLV